MVRNVTVAAVLVIMMIPIMARADGLKIGHVDLREVVARSDAGREARELYIERAKKYQTEINTRTEKLKKLKEEIDAATKKLKEKDKIPQNILDKDKQYGDQARELERMISGYQDELKIYDSDLTKKVLKDFAPVLADYAQANKYDYIFRGLDALVYASDKRDLTDELIKEFNKKRKK
jgi:Skp family chaperone for outer membrane proteins